MNNYKTQYLLTKNKYINLVGGRMPSSVAFHIIKKYIDKLITLLQPIWIDAQSKFIEIGGIIDRNIM